MANRVIKDSIWDSPTLARLPLLAELHWPRWLLLPDDHGCFNADPDVLKGKMYPKRKEFTLKKVEELQKTYHEAGLLFLWWENERLWGFFPSFNNHNFCNSSQSGEDGQRVKHRRKTPEPPKDLLNKYLKGDRNILGQAGTKVSIPSPYPIPNPDPINTGGAEKNFEKKTYGEFKNVFLADKEYQQLLLLYSKRSVLEIIDELSEYMKSKGKTYKNHYATIRAWLRKKGIRPNKICTAKEPAPKDAQGWEHPDTTPRQWRGEHAMCCVHCKRIFYL